MLFVFGECVLDVDRRELRRAGVVRPLEPKAFTVLVHLLTQRHRAVAKDELLATCWPNEFVTEAALTRCLKIIRRAVANDGVQQRLIKTLRGHGYRFIAPVETLLPPPAAPALADAVAAVPSGRPVAGPPVPPPGQPCPQCQTVNRATRQFCAACGQALWVPCAQCGFGNDPAERFCGGCGGDVAAPVPLPAGARMGPPQAYTPAHLAQRLRTTPLPSGERKPVTVLVAEVDGVRDLRRTADPDVVDEVLNRGVALAMAEVHRVEGFISQMAGQGLTALFGAPLACEDHVLRGLHAALRIQRAFIDYAAELQQTLGVALALRLGVHMGPWVVSALSADLQLTSTAAETTLDVAIALPSLAPGGTIAVSGAIQEVAAGFFRFTALGRHPLSEGAAPVEVYTCDGLGPVTSRLAGALARQHTVLQGRHQELALLQACATRVRGGQGQVVCLVGDAGMGKSRVAYECQQRLADVRWLTAQAFSYGQAMPYHAFLPLLRAVLGMQETAPPPQQRQAIRTRLASRASSLAADAPLLGHLLGVPLETETLPVLAPDVQRRRLQQLCLHVLEPPAAETPLALLVEDAHWLDPSSQELLDLLIAALARRPILVMCTTRPGFRHSWADYTYFHQVAIAPLAAEETDTLLHDLFQPYRASATLAALIRERTGGNPFFVEELVRTMQARRLLTVQGGMYEMRAGTQAALPVSIQGLVQTRLDRLPVEEKYLLQMAAIIGPEVPLPLLHACVKRGEDEIHRSLTHLQAFEFLYETRFVPTRIYTFKHVLVQDAIYQALLPSTRQSYHVQIAQVLEERFPEMVATQPELLAHHYTEASLITQAIPYWQRAGQQALQRFANSEAVRHLTTGLELLATLPEAPARVQQEIDLQIALGPALTATKGQAAPEVKQVYARARALCAQVGETPQLFPTLRGLCLFYQNSGALLTARELGEQLDRLAQRVAAPMLHLEAHEVLGSTLFFLGEYAAARMHFEQGRALANPTAQQLLRLNQGPAPRVRCLAFAANALWALGAPAQSLRRSQEALTQAQALAHPYSLALARHFAAHLHHRRREAPAVQAQAEALMTLATAQEFPLYVGYGTYWHGWALAMQGQGVADLEQMHQGLVTLLATGQTIARPFCLVLLAEAAGHAGQVAEGLHLLAESLAAFEASERGDMLAEAYRLQGELLLQQAVLDAARAEACFQQALAIARRQQAKSWELRAAASLARLWQRQGKCAAAYELLAPIYGWFSEGFDTVDLQEAKALLDTLV